MTILEVCFACYIVLAEGVLRQATAGCVRCAAVKTKQQVFAVGSGNIRYDLLYGSRVVKLETLEIWYVIAVWSLTCKVETLLTEMLINRYNHKHS